MKPKRLWFINTGLDSFAPSTLIFFRISEISKQEAGRSRVFFHALIRRPCLRTLCMALTRTPWLVPSLNPDTLNRNILVIRTSSSLCIMCTCVNKMSPGPSSRFKYRPWGYRVRSRQYHIENDPKNSKSACPSPFTVRHIKHAGRDRSTRNNVKRSETNIGRRRKKTYRKDKNFGCVTKDSVDRPGVVLRLSGHLLTHVWAYRMRAFHRPEVFKRIYSRIV